MSQPQSNMSCYSESVAIDDLTGSSIKTYTSSEVIARCKLAAVYRLVSLYGWTQLIYNHITARVGDHFLLNPFGLLYHEVTAASLIKVDLDGRVLDPGSTQFTFNRPGFVLHSAVHESRPELTAALHLHHSACVAVASMKCGFLSVSQEAAIVGAVSYHDYGGLAVDDNEKMEIARDLGPSNKILILRNHGVLVCGESIEEMLHLAHHFVLACEAQVKLIGANPSLDNVISMSEESRAQAFGVVRSGFATQGDGQETSDGHCKWKVWDLEFEAQMRWLDSKSKSSGQMVPIFVKLVDGKTMSLMVNTEDNVGDVMEQIEERVGIPPGEQRLIFGGKQLQPDYPLSAYNIDKETTLHLVLRMVGGH